MISEKAYENVGLGRVMREARAEENSQEGAKRSSRVSDDHRDLEEQRELAHGTAPSKTYNPSGSMAISRREAASLLEGSNLESLEGMGAFDMMGAKKFATGLTEEQHRSQALQSLQAKKAALEAELAECEKEMERLESIPLGLKSPEPLGKTQEPRREEGKKKGSYLKRK